MAEAVTGSAPSAPSAPSDWKARLPSSYPDHIYFQPVEGRGVGMFSKREFLPGETVLEEKPMFTRPSGEEVSKRDWTPEWEQDFCRIRVPLKFPGEAPTDAKLHANPGMVRSALGYADSKRQVRKELLKLWHPPLDSDHPIVEVARQLAVICIEHLEECRALNVSELQAAVLAIEMNIFTGGHVFQLFSRVNHSCFPNTVYIASKEGRRFRALRKIHKDEELLHCYLGEEQLMPTEIRRRHLWRSKCFHCVCERCTAELDPFRDMPCRACAAKHGTHVSSWRIQHKPGVWLRKSPSTDGAKVGFVAEGAVVKSTGRTEGKWVEHSEGSWMLTDGTALGLGVLCVPETYERSAEDPEVPNFWEHYRRYFFRTWDKPQAKYASEELPQIWNILDQCQLRPHCILDPWVEIPYARFQGDCWRCTVCGHEERNETILTLERKLGRLAEKTFFAPELIENTATYQMGKRTTNIPLIDGGFLMGALDLAETVTRVLGHWHWAAQWARILFTDATSSFQQLSNHYAMKQEPLVDLRVLWEWYKHLQLAQDTCAWFYTRLEGFKYIPEVADTMKKEMVRWKESGQPMVNLFPSRMYAMEGAVTFG